MNLKQLRQHRIVTTLIAMLAMGLGACAQADGPADEGPFAPSPAGADRPLAGRPADTPAKAQCPKPQVRADPERVYTLPVGDSPVRGADTAAVTVVVACDFQCRYCRQVQPTLERILATYGDRVRLVFKHNPLPFHPEAMNAALAAEAAREQGQFWPMHDRLLANQHELGTHHYLAWAEQLGLDVERFAEDMTAVSLRQRVEEDRQLVASQGGRGTPSFWVNGRFLNGAQPFARFETLISAQLADVDPSSVPDDRADHEGLEHDCGCGAE